MLVQTWQKPQLSYRLLRQDEEEARISFERSTLCQVLVWCLVPGDWARDICYLHLTSGFYHLIKKPQMQISLWSRITWPGRVQQWKHVPWLGAIKG